jgi:hypothetical protein
MLSVPHASPHCEDAEAPDELLAGVDYSEMIKLSWSPESLGTTPKTFTIS